MSSPSVAAYTASVTRVDGVNIVRLSGPGGTTVSIAPGIGNNAYEFLVNGKNAFWFPYRSVGEFAAEPQLCGNPLLAPWANRLDEHAFYAAGVRYPLNRDLGNYLLDSTGLPIHGLLLYSPAWEVVSLRSGRRFAEVTSQLHFSRHPALMAQFPFAHRLAMTYRLEGSTLETRTVVTNDSSDPMPLSLGFHPYFQLHDSARDDWQIRIAAERLWNLNDRFTPTGSTSPVEREFPAADALPLRGHFIDHVFGGLRRDSDGWSRFHLQGDTERVTVAYGRGFPVAVVYAPDGSSDSFVCFEPMTGITNALNLARKGLNIDLPIVPSGGSWVGAFRITVEGF